jgi:hypothetical protein
VRQTERADDRPTDVRVGAHRRFLGRTDTMAALVLAFAIVPRITIVAAEAVVPAPA